LDLLPAAALGARGELVTPTACFVNGGSDIDLLAAAR